MADRKLTPSQTGAAFARLTPAQCERLHAASLEILERTGVRLFEPEAVELVRRAGAAVSEGNRVRIPARLVEQAFSTVPRRVVLHDRLGHPVMPLEGARTYFGPGSDCLNIIDHRTGNGAAPLSRTSGTLRVSATGSSTSTS